MNYDSNFLKYYKNDYTDYYILSEKFKIYYRYLV